jgi:drug/metabolite transporter (DMT)-like permease
MSRGTGMLLISVTWLSWGFSYPMNAIALGEFDVWTLRLLVMAMGGAAMLGWARWRGASLGVPRDHWRDLIVTGLLNMAIFQICMTYGIQLLSAGRTAVIIYTMPMWAALFAVWLLGERLNRWRIGALTAGLVGLAVLLSQDLSALGNAPLGAVLTLVAAASFGLGTVWMKRRAWRLDITVIGGWQLVIGVVPVALIWALFSPPTDWAGVSGGSWLAVAFIGLVANALGYFAWFRVVAIYSATASGIASMAVPVVGVFASALLVGEVVGWRELAALGLICLALALNVASSGRVKAFWYRIAKAG